jgi:hypothetical protein
MRRGSLPCADAFVAFFLPSPEIRLSTQDGSIDFHAFF